MELDSRILEGKRPLDCLDIDIAKTYIGQKGYLANCLLAYHDLESTDHQLVYATLKEVDSRRVIAFTDDFDGEHSYFLPEEWVKPEKKCRAYTLIEFIGDMNSGVLEPWIRMRPVRTNKECKFLYTGYQETKVGEYICLGCYQFDFISLFKNYEIYINGEWQPFGVLDEDKE